jgi:hypothetical protein
LRSPVPSPPPPTEFERLVTLRRPYIEAARHDVRRYGQLPAQDAIQRDMRAGRLPREKSEHMLGYLLMARHWRWEQSACPPPPLGDMEP